MDLSAPAETQFLIKPDRVFVLFRRIAPHAVASAAAEQLQHVIQNHAAHTGSLHGGMYCQPVENTGTQPAGPGQGIIFRFLAVHKHNSRHQRAVAAHVVQVAPQDVFPDDFLTRIHAPAPLLLAALFHVIRHMLIKGKQFIQFLLCCPNQFHGVIPSNEILICSLNRTRRSSRRSLLPLPPFRRAGTRPGRTGLLWQWPPACPADCEA